ncbi:MAG: response regulator, partial [Acidobacteriota bacterium]
MSYGVLIIEDEATLAKNMRIYLRGHGYDVHIVGSRKEGHQQVESFKPDVVLLDLQLPDGDGFDILAHAHDLNSQIKVIVMTAHGDVRLAIDAMKAGAYDYLSKPVVLSELKILIDKAVERHRLEDTLSYYREREASRGDLDSIV